MRSLRDRRPVLLQSNLQRPALNKNNAIVSGHIMPLLLSVTWS